jgi:hypothetical protein
MVSTHFMPNIISPQIFRFSGQTKISLSEIAKIVDMPQLEL